MPRSKRDKKISLTKTEKKGLQWKQKIIEDIRKSVEKYPNLFVFSIENMRNSLLKDLRQEWKKNSRFFFGKNRIMQIGLGRTKSEEIEPGLHKLSRRLIGQCGLLFTQRDKSEVIDWAKNYWSIEYARSGFIATETIVLPEGPLAEFSHSIEPHLRSLGMPTKLDKGIVHLYSKFTVCEKGKSLTPEQARILKLIANPMAKFKLHIKCSWNKSDGFESYVQENGTKFDSENEIDILEDVNMEDQEDDNNNEIDEDDK
ncbi:mRNA turnover protein 4 homolog [Condylostylus longicornis]|uniref:mRNA turnover protein 4 homolog n=1 Tax=Condylostylus longicornis TaxID=2530218 RepID=UPI00244DDE20|nr:mRNA turnover protein 4 homolog [Condylostylus longicornis]